MATTNKSVTAAQKKLYDDIVKFYDFAEAMVDAVEQNPSPAPELRLRLLEPIIAQIEKSTEILAEFYINYIETGAKPDVDEKIRAEDAIKKIFEVINHYKDAVRKIRFDN